MDVKIELDGADKLDRLFREATGPEQFKAISTAMFSEAQAVLNESKKIVPVDLGTLKSSGAVSKPRVVDGAVEVEISYGGAASKYALIVHEDPTANHKPGKTYKYLEIPVMAAREKFVRAVMVRYAAYLRRIT